RMTNGVVMARGTESELRHVQPGEVKRSRLIESVQNGCRLLWPVIRENAGAPGGDPAGAVEHVLVSQRNTVQGAVANPFCEIPIRALRCGKRPIGINLDDPVEALVYHVESFQTSEGDRDRGELSSRDSSANLDQAEIVDRRIQDH